jgi:hypothetical protein
MPSISTATGTRACSKDEESLKASPVTVAVTVAVPESLEVLTSVAPTIKVEVEVGTAVAQIPLSPLHVAKFVSVAAKNVVLCGEAVPVPMLESVPPVPTARLVVVVAVGADLPPLSEKRAE